MPKRIKNFDDENAWKEHLKQTAEEYRMERILQIERLRKLLNEKDDREFTDEQLKKIYLEMVQGGIEHEVKIKGEILSAVARNKIFKKQLKKDRKDAEKCSLAGKSFEIDY